MLVQKLTSPKRYVLRNAMFLNFNALLAQGGVTALHIASYKGLQSAMESLIRCGADVNRKDNV